MANFMKDDGTANVPSELREDVLSALHAITFVIVNTLKSDRADRFAEAERLTKTAQQLVRAVSARVETFVKKQEQAHIQPGTFHVTNNATTDANTAITLTGNTNITYEEYEAQQVAQEEYGGTGGAVYQAMPQPYEGDHSRNKRDYQEVQGTLVQIKAEEGKAIIAQAEAKELSDLQRLQVEDEDTKVVAARIEQLLSNMRARARLDGDENEVVHSDVSRGHSTGSPGQEEDTTEGVQSDTQRGTGDVCTEGESVVAQVGVAVGHG